MERIIDGRLWNDAFMYSVGSRTFDRTDPVTEEPCTYREELMRELALKPGHTLADTWVAGNYGRKIVLDNCDLTKGQFVLKITRGWSDGKFILLPETEARSWFEKWCPDQTDQYRKVFGEPENPWTDDGTVKLVEEAESRLSAMEWDKKRAEERADKAEAEAAALKARIEPPARVPEVSESACGEDAEELV